MLIKWFFTINQTTAKIMYFDLLISKQILGTDAQTNM
jgi:hypothetical protein